MICPELSWKVIVGWGISNLALDHGRVGVQVVADVVHNLPPENDLDIIVFLLKICIAQPKEL